MKKTLTRFSLCFRVMVFIGCTQVLSNGCSLPTCNVFCRDTMIKQAQQAYLNEDYILSRQIFSQLVSREDSVQCRTAGLYGNVCLDMILAENAPAFRAAVENYLLLPSRIPCRVSTLEVGETSRGETVCNPWSRMHPGMLEKAMAHGMVLLESERSDSLNKLNALYAKEEIYKKERMNMQKEHVNMQKEIDSLGGKIKALERRNSTQEARITDLLHQISVLEKIDKERQEQRENP